MGGSLPGGPGLTGLDGGGVGGGTGGNCAGSSLLGGGSFDAGADQILMADFQTGNGEVVITESRGTRAGIYRVARRRSPQLYRGVPEAPAERLSSLADEEQLALADLLERTIGDEPSRYHHGFRTASHPRQPQT